MDQPPRRERLRPLIVSCLGLGYSPVMPGTCGALVGPLVYLPLAWIAPHEPLQTLLLAAALGVWSAITVALGGWAETYYGKKDCQVVVTDEVAGFLLTVLLFHLPERPLLTTLLAFPATRLFDILKLPPARRLEKLPRGWGVLADDLMSSVYAAALVHAVWWGWQAS